MADMETSVTEGYGDTMRGRDFVQVDNNIRCSIDVIVIPDARNPPAAVGKSKEIRLSVSRRIVMPVDPTFMG
ncbi:MAG: hypothetical protein ACYSYM_07565 [Planctomycetota bacterium]